ncbi:MAG: hypothetical protein NXI29_01190 [bacterium]|uniref:Uncharacterized protein n=1 Tax=Gimesia chilikensis TaxID=2605989 RepID=A0A517PNV4_9PLAN|nr:hypothetical protein [Gimesia chilikensis]MCR9229609.1 hypothetical protein [bacterium]QDT21049.1 hypothetical protein HG66A1_28420 [Gimesia chilikensis]
MYEQIARESSSTEVALEKLHRAGAGPIEAIKALRAGRGLTLAEAKQRLHQSPAWSTEVRNAELLHEALWEALDEEDLQETEGDED